MAYLKVTRKEDLKSSHHKEKNFVTICDDDVNQIYYDDHLTMHINIKSLYQMPKTNTISIFFKKEVSEGYGLKNISDPLTYL